MFITGAPADEGTVNSETMGASSADGGPNSSNTTTTTSSGDTEVKEKLPVYHVSHSLSAPTLSYLWSFRCEETDGRNVSGMDWNRLNQVFNGVMLLVLLTSKFVPCAVLQDMLASSYGQFDFGNSQSGLISLWTLKNPGFPERIITCKFGVMCIDFSTTHPHLLAAGILFAGLDVFKFSVLDFIITYIFCRIIRRIRCNIRYS